MGYGTAEAGIMGYGAAEVTGLGFVCFVVINPRVLSSNKVDFDLFSPPKFSNWSHPPPPACQTHRIWSEFC